MKVTKVPLLGLSCREASRLASESLDRELTRRERWALRIHIWPCRACQKFAAQIRLLRFAAAELPESLRNRWVDDAVKLSAVRRTQIKRLLAEMIEAGPRP